MLRHIWFHTNRQWQSYSFLYFRKCILPIHHAFPLTGKEFQFRFSNQNTTIFIDVHWVLFGGGIHANSNFLLIWGSGRITTTDFGPEFNGFILFDNFSKIVMTSNCSVQSTCIFPMLFVVVGIKQSTNISSIGITHDARCNIVWSVPKQTCTLQDGQACFLWDNDALIRKVIFHCRLNKGTFSKSTNQQKKRNVFCCWLSQFSVHLCPRRRCCLWFHRTTIS